MAYREMAESFDEAHGGFGSAPKYPSLHNLLSGLMYALSPGHEVVIAGVVDPHIAGLAPYLRGQDAVDGQATAYVCRNTACELPTTDGGKMVALLTAGR